MLNDAYRGLAEHYSAAVLPGRVRKPKDKPSAENTVWHATMAFGRRDARPPVRLVGRAADREYARGSWNTIPRPFQKRDGSRLSVFEGEEKPRADRVGLRWHTR